MANWRVVNSANKHAVGHSLSQAFLGGGLDRSLKISFDTRVPVFGPWPHGLRLAQIMSSLIGGEMSS